MKIGFGGLLTIVFITLKLCGVIEWSWLWVLSPLWIGLLIGLVLAGIVIAADKSIRSDFVTLSDILRRRK